MSGRESSAPAGEIGIDRRAFMLALGTFAIGTDAFIIAGILPGIAEDLSTSIGRAGMDLEPPAPKLNAGTGRDEAGRTCLGIRR